MLIEKHIPNRQKDEQLVLFLRRHGIIVIGHWFFYILLALIPVGIYIFLNYQFPDILIGPITYPFLLLLGSVYYLYILLFFYNAFIDYNLDVWIVTSRRIINIEQKGLFNREIAEHSLDKIQDVSAHQKGLFATIFRYGDIHVQTAGEVQRFVFRQVKNPFDVVKTINELLKIVNTQMNRPNYGQMPGQPQQPVYQTPPQPIQQPTPAQTPQQTLPPQNPQQPINPQM